MAPLHPLQIYYVYEGGNLLFFFRTFLPENNTKHDTNDNRLQETDGVVLRVPPVRPVLLPEAGSALGGEGLRELGRKVEISRARRWSAQLFDELLVLSEQIDQEIH